MTDYPLTPMPPVKPLKDELKIHDFQKGTADDGWIVVLRSDCGTFISVESKNPLGALLSAYFWSHGWKIYNPTLMIDKCFPNTRDKGYITTFIRRDA